VPPTLPAGVLPGGCFADWSPPVASYVVCDVDGTLVGRDHHASEEVVAAISRAQAAGVHVGFATGRMRDAVASLQGQLGTLGPNIFHNGAEVRAGGTTVVAWTLTPEQIDRMLAIARERDDAYVEIYTETGYVASSWDERARPHWDLLGAEPTAVLARAAELGSSRVLKATFAAFDPRAVDELTARITAAGLLAGAAGSPLTPGLIYVNATHPDADKGQALRRAAAHLGTELSEVVAIGDAANDLSMLAVAGTAIAMGQAPEEIRAAAHLIVPDVDAHGVAVALDAVVAWRCAA
jgi:Cof subfamily protein (haloacid dehalogenase superfamily)